MTRTERDTMITMLALGALGVAAYCVYNKRSPLSLFGVRGVWTDLATKQGIAVGTDLSVQEIQGYLNGINNQTPPAKGGNGLAVDGILGPKTIAALKKFQAGQGLAQTGRLDEETGNALSYFAAATSKSGAVKKLAAVAPSTIASLSHSVPGGLQPVDIGSGWVMYGSCACRWDDAACAARCGGAFYGAQAATSGEFRTGIQSSSPMYDPRFYYTDIGGADIDGGYQWG
jgi:peptidoglycan hydrolase-like protein with peptidoglycan-binding domain